jgi:DNA invertase Pin-like site-specific DNA recombinase
LTPTTKERAESEFIGEDTNSRSSRATLEKKERIRIDERMADSIANAQEPGLTDGRLPTLRRRRGVLTPTRRRFPPVTKKTPAALTPVVMTTRSNHF